MYGLAWDDRGGDIAYWPTMIMEYCPCTLAELQRERKSNLSTLLKFQIIQGVSFGVNALHQEDIIHGDIKSENILIKVLDDRLIIPKLADFGSSVIGLNEDLVEIRGTERWQAPEVRFTISLKSLMLNFLVPDLGRKDTSGNGI
jgi:serine/threonine protein kinase